MVDANNPARKRLITQVLDATTLAEVSAATMALSQWMDAHPDDWGMADAFEQLSMMQDIAEEQEAARRPLATAGRAA